MLHDWFDVDEMGDFLRSAVFASTLRENIARYFGVPLERQAVYDEDGLLQTGADFSRALQRVHPKLFVYDVNELSRELRDRTIEELQLIDQELERSWRHFGVQPVRIGHGSMQSSSTTLAGQPCHQGAQAKPAAVTVVDARTDKPSAASGQSEGAPSPRRVWANKQQQVVLPASSAGQGAIRDSRSHVGQMSVNALDAVPDSSRVPNNGTVVVNGQSMVPDHSPRHGLVSKSPRSPHPISPRVLPSQVHHGQNHVEAAQDPTMVAPDQTGAKAFSNNPPPEPVSAPRAGTMVVDTTGTAVARRPLGSSLVDQGKSGSRTPTHPIVVEPALPASQSGGVPRYSPEHRHAARPPSLSATPGAPRSQVCGTVTPQPPPNEFAYSAPGATCYQGSSAWSNQQPQQQHPMVVSPRRNYVKAPQCIVPPQQGGGCDSSLMGHTPPHPTWCGTPHVAAPPAVLAYPGAPLYHQAGIVSTQGTPTCASGQFPSVVAGVGQDHASVARSSMTPPVPMAPCWNTPQYMPAHAPNYVPLYMEPHLQGMAMPMTTMPPMRPSEPVSAPHFEPLSAQPLHPVTQLDGLQDHSHMRHGSVAQASATAVKGGEVN